MDVGLYTWNNFFSSGVESQADSSDSLADAFVAGMKFVGDFEMPGKWSNDLT